MPTLRIPPDLDLHYVVDDFTDPWSKPSTVLMLHHAEFRIAPSSGIVATRSDCGNVVPLSRRPTWTELG